MSEQIDLDRRSYRAAPDGPLERPRVLWGCIALFGGLMPLGVWVALYIGEWWSPLLPATFGFGLGIAMAGLVPKFFFGRRDT